MPTCSRPRQPPRDGSIIARGALQNERDQLGHLEESLQKERARQAAARKRAEEAERLKADELSAVAERNMQMQAKLAEAAAENDARDARKALEDAMQLKMDMAETEVSSTSAELLHRARPQSIDLSGCVWTLTC